MEESTNKNLDTNSLSGKISKSLLYEAVVKRLIDIINSGAISPGDQFPPERELVKDLGVSRNVLREAFHILEERGIIMSVQGKGRFLRQIETPKIQQSSLTFELERCSLLEIYQVREILELSAMDMLVRRADPKIVAELQEIYKNLFESFRKTNSTVGEFQMHLAYADRCGNYFLSYLVHITIDKIESALKFMGNPFSGIVGNYRIERFEKDHAAILEALEKGNAEDARNAMEAHLSRTKHNVDLLS